MHWIQPIGIKKKVVVTHVKLMHGVSIPLVVDKTALNKSIVHEIVRQVCSVINNNFGHFIVWLIGRWLARITFAFHIK